MSAKTNFHTKFRFVVKFLKIGFYSNFVTKFQIVQTPFKEKRADKPVSYSC